MRVGVVTGSFPRFDGDHAGAFVAEHARTLVARGHRVEVVCAGSTSSALAIEGVTIHRVGGPSPFYRGGAPEELESGVMAWARAAAYTGMLSRKLAEKSRDWDAIYAHWLVPSALASALVIGKRIPMVAMAHSGDVHLLRRLHLVSVLAAVLVRVDAQIAFVSQHLRDLFLSEIRWRRLRCAVAKRSIVQSVGVDVARFDRASQRIERRPGRVVFVGRLVPIKGVDVLLGAATRWRASELVIAGDGPDRPRLETLARQLGVASRVRFVGFVGNRRRDELLASASVVVIPSVPLPSRTEGTPAVALEAMAAGSPVVASATGGLASLPVVSVAPNNPRELAAAVDRVLEASRSKEQVSIQRAWVNNHDWAVVSARLEDLIRG